MATRFCTDSSRLLYLLAASLLSLAGQSLAEETSVIAAEEAQVTFWYYGIRKSESLCEIERIANGSQLLSIKSRTDGELTIQTPDSQVLDAPHLALKQWVWVEINFSHTRLTTCVDFVCGASSIDTEDLMKYTELRLQCNDDLTPERIHSPHITSGSQSRSATIKVSVPCIYTPVPIIQPQDIQLDFFNTLQFDYVLQPGVSICYGLTDKRAYPDFDNFDPIPSIDRGLFFGRVNFASNLLIAGMKNPIVLGQGLTMELWVRMVGTKDILRFVFMEPTSTKKYLSFQIFTFQRDSSITFSIEGVESNLCWASIDLDMAEMKGKWMLAGFSLGYDNDKTRVLIFWNNHVTTKIIPLAIIPTEDPRIAFDASGRHFLYRIYITKREKSMGEIVQHIANYDGCIGPTGLSKCIPTCDFNYYVDATGQCLPCLPTCQYGCVRPTDCSLCADPLCYRCSTFSSGSCSECVTSASFVSGQCTCNPGTFQFQGQCIFDCPDGYFFDNFECKRCSRGCEICDKDSCIKCGSSLLWVDGTCTCNLGYFIDADYECVKCVTPCLECIDIGTRCTQCLTLSGYVLLSNDCTDCSSIPGYRGGLGVEKQPPNLSEKESINAVCKEICGDGLTMGQLECDDGNLIDGDGCSSKCEIEEGWDCTIPILGGKSVCVDKRPPTLILTYEKVTNSGYLFSVSFSEDVVMTESLDSNTEVKVEGVSLFSYTFTENTNATYDLSLELFENVKNDSELSVQILHPQSIKDARGNIISPYTYSAQIPDSFSVKSTAAISTAMQGVSTSVGVVATGSFLSSAFAGSSLNFLWGLLEALQIINYLVFLSCILPANLQAFLRALNFANFDFIPNFFAKFDDTFNPPHRPFVSEDVSTGFLTNCGHMVTIWAITLIFFLLFAIASKLIPALALLRKVKNKFIYSVFLRTGLESFLQLSLSITLQFANPIPYSVYDFISLIFSALVTFLLIGMLICAIMNVCTKSRETLKSSEHKRKFGTFYEEFSTKFNWTKSFVLFQLSRKLIFILLLVFMSPFSAIQSILVAILNVFFAIILLYFRPFKKPVLTNRKEIASECLFTIALALITVFSYDISITSRNNIGWVVISILTCMITLHFVCLLRVQFASCKEVLAKLNAKLAAREKKYDQKERLLDSDWAEDRRKGVVPMADIRALEMEVVTTQPMEQSFQTDEDSKEPIEHIHPTFKR